ncbi:MAG: TerB family tellurite resistance protein [Myxococcota bacterium]
MSTVEDASEGTFEAVVMLYVASSKLPDGEISDAEAAQIMALIRKHSPGLTEGYGDQVVHDVARDLASATTPQARLGKVVAAAERVHARLDAGTKQMIVRELDGITQADGVQSSAERDFVRAAARTFGLAD